MTSAAERRLSARSRRARCAALALSLLCIASTSEARECGDSVGGVRVPCGCGDTVVSDTVLRPHDPVVSSRCSLDGLTLRASDHAETLTLNLGGLAMVGSGSGIGIQVENGGSEGAVVIGGADGHRGEIVGFNVGVAVRKPETVRRIQGLVLKGNRRDGLDLRTAGTIVIGVRAERNGSDGVRVRGRGGRLLDIESVENGEAGVRVYGFDLVVEARAFDNSRHGIVTGGYRSDIRRSVSMRNRGYGVLVAGTGHRVDGVVSDANVQGQLAYRNGGLK